MQDQHTNFDHLFRIATSCFDKSDKEIEILYKEYPICKIEYINNDMNEHVVEIRFDKYDATITYYLSEEYTCIGSYLFFDDEPDEGLFIHYLALKLRDNNLSDNWMLWISRLKIKQAKDCLCFQFFK
ncbi:MAG: hypothetical protein ACRC77_13065 [Bacteroidales bacterium]